MTIPVGPPGGSPDPVALNRRVAELERTLATRDQSINELRLQIRSLEDQLHAGPVAGAAVPPGVAPVSLDALSQSLRAVIQSFQAPDTSPTPSDIAVVIKSMDLELKAFVAISGGHPFLDLPAAGRTIDPASLSTIRLSLAQVPNPLSPAAGGGNH